MCVCLSGVQLLLSELPRENSNGLRKNSSMPSLQPLDLRCNAGGNGRSTATSPSQRGGYGVAVSRRCAPPVVPANTAPSTSLPRTGSSSVVTTMKLNARRHSSNGGEAGSSSATVGVPRKRCRDTATSSPSEKLSRVSSQSARQLQQTVEAAASASAASDGQLSASSSFQHPAAAVVARTAVAAGEVAGPSPPVPVSPVSVSPVSVPVVLTGVNGMLVPLSSAPRGTAIIVVNCAATTTTSQPPASTSGGARLCPIAPAPPPPPPRPVTRQSEPSSPSSAPGSTDDGGVAAGSTSSSSTAHRRTYRCDEPGCGKTYFKNSHLKVHRRVHTGVTLLFSERLPRDCCC